MAKKIADVNYEEDDIVLEKNSLENLSVQEMLDAKIRYKYGKSAKEEYVDNIVDIVSMYRGRDDLDKTEKDLYKRALEQIEWIYGIKKNKEPLKVFTKAWTMQDIQNRLNNF